MELEIVIWFLLGGLVYSFREAEMWITESSPKWLQSHWWLGFTDRLPWYTFQFYKDAYHFFGNFMRVAIAIKLGFIFDIEVSLIFFSAWAVGRFSAQWYMRG